MAKGDVELSQWWLGNLRLWEEASDIGRGDVLWVCDGREALRTVGSVSC